MKLSLNKHNIINRNSFVSIFVAISAMYIICLSSCSTPYVHLPKHDKVHTDPYGAMITIRFKDNDNKLQISTGELLSVENDSVYVLTKLRTTYKNKNQEMFKIVTAHQDKVTSYRVVFANSEPNGAFLASGILGLAHGFFLLVSIPLNVVAGAIIMGEEKYLYSFSHKDLKISDLYQYARFPIGIPQNTDLSDLKLRPLGKENKI